MCFMQLMVRRAGSPVTDYSNSLVLFSSESSKSKSADDSHNRKKYDAQSTSSNVVVGHSTRATTVILAKTER